jgi:hypothetical protein
MRDWPAELSDRTAQVPQEFPLYLAITLVMLVWGVASEALREIITGFLDEVRFE